MFLQSLKKFHQRLSKILRKQNVTDPLSFFRELQRKITPIVSAPSPYFFISSICLVHMNVFAKFEEIPSKTLQDIKETKRHRHTFVRSGITKGNNSYSISP